MTRILTALAVLTLFCAGAFAQDLPGDGTPQPLGSCCGPADIQDAPAGVGCDGECYNRGNSSEAAIHCAYRGNASPPYIGDGGCHVSEPGLTCAMTDCTIDVDEFFCRRKRCVASGQVKCVWEDGGDIIGHPYRDCSGNNCWGGGAATACDEDPWT